MRQKQILEIQLKKLEAEEKVSSGNLDKANSQNQYSEFGIKDLSHLQQIINSIETQINELNRQFQLCNSFSSKFGFGDCFFKVGFFHCRPS